MGKTANRHWQKIDVLVYFMTSGNWQSLIFQGKPIINLQRQHDFEVFVKLLAGRVGQLLNLASLSDDIGINAVTLAEWLNVLEASYIIFRLPPYFENYGKRLVKTPKVYFTDVGLAA